jgi:excisionase family DNA binding protein
VSLSLNHRHASHISHALLFLSEKIHIFLEQSIMISDHCRSKIRKPTLDKHEKNRTVKAWRGQFTVKPKEKPGMKAMKKEPKAAHALDADEEGEEYLRISEVAAMLHCSTPTAYRMASNGVLPTFRLCGMLRVPKRKLMRIITERSTDGISAA